MADRRRLPVRERVIDVSSIIKLRVSQEDVALIGLRGDLFLACPSMAMAEMHPTIVVLT
ncbi:hypothetical protein [Burkholderia cepacia]|uniref:hypothetical protein n=1 Tax=Burkholderia cepacia TaxID=292 RepID=UPI001F235CC1|nr:hypothetical protein [Burkholderia cepacia]